MDIDWLVQANSDQAYKLRNCTFKPLFEQPNIYISLTISKHTVSTHSKLKALNLHIFTV